MRTEFWYVSTHRKKRTKKRRRSFKKRKKVIAVNANEVKLIKKEVEKETSVEGNEILTFDKSFSWRAWSLSNYLTIFESPFFFLSLDLSVCDIENTFVVTRKWRHLEN